MAQINKPSSYFNTVLYTGNGSTQSISGVGFQPDMTWVKSRTTGGSTNNNHCINDVVRAKGSFGYPMIHPNLTAAEYDPTSGNEVVIDFQSDGFSLGGNENSNYNTATYVAWNWLAGGTASSNTDGSITSSVSASTTSGFSIVSYTGNGTDNATVGHGLGQKPDCLIVKNRNEAIHGWGYWNKGLGAETQQMALNLTNAVFTDDVFKSSSSSTVTLGTDNWSNKNSATYIMYCFAEKKGFSKFGSYTGNASTDGPMIYTGFKPAFVLLKDTSASNSWWIYDNKRDTFNLTYHTLLPDSSGAEETNTGYGLDFVSSGFKLRMSDQRQNGSGKTYIYMAFAESPLVGTNNIPATAR